MRALTLASKVKRGFVAFRDVMYIILPIDMKTNIVHVTGSIFRIFLVYLRKGTLKLVFAFSVNKIENKIRFR